MPLIEIALARFRRFLVTVFVAGEHAGGDEVHIGAVFGGDPERPQHACGAARERFPRFRKGFRSGFSLSESLTLNR